MILCDGPNTGNKDSARQWEGEIEDIHIGDICDDLKCEELWVISQKFADVLLLDTH